MIYAMMQWNGKEQLCCVDKIGRRAFLTDDFFLRDLKELRIESNAVPNPPRTMEELIRGYNAEWTDDTALFFGSNPDLGIDLDPEQNWAPLVRVEEAWSPLAEARGRALLD